MIKEVSKENPGIIAQRGALKTVCPIQAER